VSKSAKIALAAVVQPWNWPTAIHNAANLIAFKACICTLVGIYLPFVVPV
jgi:hypothetical protein